MFTLLQKNIPEDLFLSVYYIHFCSNIIHICHSVYRWVDPKDLSNDTWRSNKKPNQRSWSSSGKIVADCNLKFSIVVLWVWCSNCCGPPQQKGKKEEKIIIMAAFHTHIQLSWSVFDFETYIILSAFISFYLNTHTIR